MPRASRKATITLLSFLALVALLSGCREAGLYEELGPLNGQQKGLGIGPGTATVAIGTSTLLAGLGGSPPYSYALTSGLGTIDSLSGIYTAPGAGSEGPVSVRVTDSAGDSATASVTVVDTGGALSLSPLFVTVPPGGTLAFTASGGSGNSANYTYSIATNESGSPGVPGGAYTAGSSEGTDVIRVEDSVTLETRYARVAVAVGSSSVDYDVINVDTAAFSAGGGAGQTISITNAFDIQNNGSDAGSEDVFWRVYYSSDTSLGAGDSLLSEGVIAGGLGPGAINATSVSISTGTWPDTGGSGYILIQIEAQDDGNLSNNLEGPVATTVTAPSVDYSTASVTYTGATAYRSFDGTFDITNSGESGATSIQWNAYISSDATLGGDTLFDSGTLSALPNGGSHLGVVFNGSWGSPGTYYILVEVAAANDAVPSNDVASSTAITTTAPAVDYEVTSVADPSGTEAGGPVTGNFGIQNVGADDGTRTVFWAVYASTDQTLDGGDITLDSGQRTYLAAGGTDTVSYSGYWPDSVGTYYIIAEIAAADDIDSSAASNTEASTNTTTTIATETDFAAGTVSVDPSYLAGEGATGTFTITNNGPGDAASEVTYIIYASSDTTLDANDYVVASGTQYPFAASDSQALSFSGTWPAVPGTYHIIGEVLASRDYTTGDNVQVGPSVNITEPPADYAVASVSLGTYDIHPASSVAGTFTYENNGPYDGAGTLSYKVWASTDTVLSTAGDFLLDFGSGLSPLDNGVTSGSVAFSGSWPLTYGNYYLIVEITAPNDPALSDNTLSTGTSVDVGIYDEEAAEYNGNYTNVNDGVNDGDLVNVVNCFDPGIVLQPGMTILIRGAGTAGDVDPNIAGPSTNDDIIAFDTGTASAVGFQWVLDSGVAQDIGLFVMDGDNSFPWPGPNVTDSFISDTFTVDAANTLRWVDLENTSQADLGTYSLYITAE